MADMSPGKRRKLKQFDVALATRQFEIDLFWKRSLFFWGFIVAAFVAVAALEGKSRSLSIIVSGFGMVSSLGWTLANRGSKYWQEQWEKKIEKVEDKITGPLFKQEEPQQDKGFWLSGRQFSVSKLVIALSDYTLLVWIAIFLRQVLLAIGCSGVGHCRLFAIFVLCLVPFFYMGLVFGFGRTTPRSK